MQFSDTSTNLGLVQDVTFLTGADTNAYPTADRTRNINRYYYKAVIQAWKSSSDWEFDDSNVADYPIATTTMVASQPDYSIPTNALKILRVEVKDNSGNWTIVKPIDEEQIKVALDEFEKTDGLPRFYRAIRRNVVLYPAPATSSVTLSAGLKIYFLREVDEFAATDTTQEPGIAEPFHRILSLGAAYDFALAKGLPNQTNLKLEFEQLLKELSEFYNSRHRDFRQKLRPKIERYN